MVRRITYRVSMLVGWVGGAVLVLAFFVLATLAAAIITFSTYYPKTNPLNLSPLLAQAQSYISTVGLKVTANQLDMYYDNGTIVVRGADVRVFGADGELAITTDAVTLNLSRRRLFAGAPAPKSLSAEGVTLRLVRNNAGLHVAGLNLTSSSKTSEGPNFGGFVAWLNNLDTTLRWGALEEAAATKLTLLLRDDVQNTEWVMENGQLAFSRNNDGEHATLAADLRRLYGGKALPVMPVLAMFEHTAGGPDATVRARLERSDVSMVADYFPPSIQKMFKAQGRVELGVLLTEGNQLGRPWLTLRLRDVAIRAPKGFSKPLRFPQFNVTVSYQPTPTDVMTISNLEATHANGLVFHGKGTLTGLADIADDSMAELEPAAGPADVSPTLVIAPTNPLPPTLAVDMTFQAAGGKGQHLFDMFPDNDKAFKKILAWLRPNVLQGEFRNLLVHYKGHPSAFPACGDACGVTITANIAQGGKIRYIDNVAPATLTTSSTFTLAGETIRIVVPEATTSAQHGSNIVVAITELFSPEVDTAIDVQTTLGGPLDDVVREVGRIERPLPLTADGTHASTLHVYLPLKRGKTTSMDDAEITVASTLNDYTLSRFTDLANTTFTGPTGTFAISGSVASFAGAGKLNDESLKLTWQDNWRDKGVHAMKLEAEGRVPASWLKANILKGDAITLAGVVALKASLQEDGDTMTFDVSGNGREASLGVPALNWVKPAGNALTFAATGGLVSTDKNLHKLNFQHLKLDGAGAHVEGNLTYVPDNLPATRINLAPFQLGRTNGSLTWDGTTLALKGTSFDFTALNTDSSKTSTTPDMAARIDVQTMYMKNGNLTDVKAEAFHRNEVWEVGNVQAMAEGTPVQVVQTLLPGQAGRKRLSFNIADLGKLLTITDAYTSLRKGRLEGELTYDTPRIAGGVLNLKDFELINPPTITKVLGLLSLEQLFAGTDTLLFDKAIIPLRLEGPAVYLDKMVMKGPAMNLELDGVYYRHVSELDMNGRLTPALPMNRVVAQIPLLGTLLTGSQDGLIVADFRMKGKTDDPKIEVRPLSVLTPGLLKDIFRGGDGNRPKPKVKSNVP